MIRLRGGRGLGDSLYLRPIVDYLVRLGERVTALSDYPDVFLASGAEVQPFTRQGVVLLAHYRTGIGNPQTTQWQDVLRSARMPEGLPLRFSWTVRNATLVDALQARAAGKPLVLVHGGREPMNRTDGFALELMPERAAFATALDALRDCFLVRVGRGPRRYELPADADLDGDTTVADLLDVASQCAGVVAQCSFAVPLAECFDKPLLAIWSARGLVAREAYIRQLTPRKILCSTRDAFVMDDWSAKKIKGGASAFRDSMNSGA